MNDAMELNHDLPLSAEQALAVQLGRAPLHLGLNLAGPLQASRLHEALLQVIQRHTSLRVALRPSTLYRSLRQSTVPASLDWHLLGTAQHAEAQALAAQPQAVEQGCLVRAILRPQGADQWRLDLYVAACAADRLSLQNLLGELAALYAQPDAALEEPFQYSQYVEWRNDLDADEEAPAGRAYWAGLGLEGLAPVRLGGLREPAAQAPGNAVQQALSEALQAQLEHLAQRSEQSVGSVLQAAWWALLARIGGDARFIGGWQQDCRFEYDALANGIGAYEKILPLALAPQLDQPFGTWLQQLAEQLDGHAQQQEYWHVNDPAHTLQRTVGFTLVRDTAPFASGGLHWSVDALPGADVGFALALQATLDAQERVLALSVQSPTAHYAEADLRCLLEQYLHLLQALVEQPSQRALLELPLSPPAHQALQQRLRGPQRDFGSRPLIARLAHWAQRTPDAAALQDGALSLTYGQLHGQVEHLAAVLQARGIGRGAAVALLLPRSAQLLLALLAVMRAGAAYVPLDPTWPAARQQRILADAQPQLVIGGAQGIALGELLEAPAGALASSDIALDDAAYLLYTSGTSGEPKGVVIEHGQLLNYTAAVSEALSLGQCKRFALISSVAADLGNTTLYAALWTGACLVLADDHASRDANAFARFLEDGQIDCLKIVPSHLAALLDGQPAIALPQVLVLGGEACPAALRQRIGQLAAASRVHNHYGPTETTVGVLYSLDQTPDPRSPLPLEQALANTWVRLLQASPTGLQPAPIGALGELYIGGAQVCRGYLNRASDAFIDDPLQPGQRLYRSGDLARLAANGQLHLAGRVDQQIKIRGFRVEPGELEAALLALEGVSQAVVQYRDGKLLAHAVSQRDSAALLAELRGRLPDYLIPAQLLCLAELPRLANGKVDFTALPSSDSTASEQLVVPPRDALEALLVDLYQELLERPQVSINDSLFDLGGHSLIVIKLCTRLRNLLQLEVAPALVFDHPSVAALGAALRAGESRPGQLLKIAELRRQLAALSPEERAALQARAQSATVPRS
ncbi:amino acid adenylation domain-containing protein [Pseudomonas sp. SK]|uniref:amino acid adenylation domain-containing protein n=1 Tax=Pseudomonas sp. SK TaxID=2729423 RepID=UPI001462D3BC|nr:amino acid adenylation domain-containing protein [Pseudomonas sp. SK]QJQ21523.1 amino acid adenylation domain-containing protein [Pseudomonas sp. SK]